MRARIARGDIGRVLSVTGSYTQDWLLYPTDYNWRVEPDGGTNLRAVADIGTHWMDLAQFVVGRPIRYLGKSELFGVPVVGWLLTQAGVFPLERTGADRGALRRALAFLAAGEPVGIFPEGHRSPDGVLQRARAGVGFLARRSDALIVPVASEGTDRVVLGRFWRRDVTLHFGEGFRASDVRAADEQALADEIMRRIAAMLPPERRGPYADREPS
jgi:1-acyl-sn-glycerol-3-phosphate acyltransferase